MTDNDMLNNNTLLDRFMRATADRAELQQRLLLRAMEDKAALQQRLLFLALALPPETEQRVKERSEANAYRPTEWIQHLIACALEERTDTTEQGAVVANERRA